MPVDIEDELEAAKAALRTKDAEMNAILQAVRETYWDGAAAKIKDLPDLFRSQAKTADTLREAARKLEAKNIEEWTLLTSKIEMLGENMTTEDGKFSFPDGDYVNTKKGKPTCQCCGSDLKCSNQRCPGLLKTSGDRHDLS